MLRIRLTEKCVDNAWRTLISDLIDPLLGAENQKLNDGRVVKMQDKARAFQLKACAVLKESKLESPNFKQGESLLAMSFSVQNFNSEKLEEVYFDAALGADVNDSDLNSGA